MYTCVPSILSLLVVDALLLNGFTLSFCAMCKICIPVQMYVHVITKDPWPWEESLLGLDKTIYLREHRTTKMPFSYTRDKTFSVKINHMCGWSCKKYRYKAGKHKKTTVPYYQKILLKKDYKTTLHLLPDSYSVYATM